MKIYFSVAAVLLSIMLLSPGCARNDRQGVTLIMPSESVAGERYTPSGEMPSRRYVVRMSDGRRDWEIEFPEVATGYELAIPLDSAPPSMRVMDDTWTQTSADMELLRRLRRENPEMEREGVFTESGALLDELAGEVTGRTGVDESAKLDETGPAPTRPSYLLGIDEVQRLYRSGNYEVAMVKLVDLSAAYPKDVRLLSMKGSLWLRLGQPELAVEAWEEVLRIEPDNAPVLRALGTLNRRQD